MLGLFGCQSAGKHLGEDPEGACEQQVAISHQHALEIKKVDSFLVGIRKGITSMSTEVVLLLYSTMVGSVWVDRSSPVPPSRRKLWAFWSNSLVNGS